MAPAPLVSIVIVTHDRRDQLLRLLATVRESEPVAGGIEIIIVDNASTDGTPEAVAAACPECRILRQAQNLYSAGGRNIGAAAASGEFIFFIDDDNILDPRCIASLAAALERDPRLGIVAPLMLCHPEKDVIWCAGGRLDRFGLPRHLFEGRRRSEVDLPELIRGLHYFPNAYMMRAALFRRGITHDVENFPHNWNEQDLGARVQAAGHGLATVTAAVTWHDVGYSSHITRVSSDKTFDQARARVLYRRKYRNSFGSWAFFFLILLPLSTLYYIRAFLKQRQEGFWPLLRAYLRGTAAGFRKKL